MAKKRTAPASAAEVPDAAGTATLPNPAHLASVLTSQEIPISPSELPPSDTNGTMPESGTAVPQNGNGEQRKPVHVLSYLVSKDTYVQASIWDRTVSLADGSTFVTHDVSVRKRYRESQSGEWKSLYSFRGSEIYAVLHALAQASAWILEARVSAQSCPF